MRTWFLTRIIVFGGMGIAFLLAVAIILMVHYITGWTLVGLVLGLAAMVGIGRKLATMLNRLDGGDPDGVL